MKEKISVLNIPGVRGKRGFTLVEILIGVAIFALILMMLNEFMMHGRRQTENVFQKGDNLREARLALQWFETDVRNSAEIKEFDENAERITMTLKHAKEIKINVDPVASEPMVYDYITYTFYLKAANANGAAMKPMTLARDVSDTEPAQGALASKNILLKSYSDNMTANPIGVLPSYDYAVDGAGTVKKESRFFAIDKNYYFNKMWDDAVPLAQKDEMIARASFKGKLNGAEVGYTDLKNSVGVWLQFIVGDNNKNVYYFNEIVYMRSKI